jgi:hypothetical protein
MDSRTWWRRGDDVTSWLYDVEPKEWPDIKDSDYDTWDCAWEQLWAIREGLA